MSHNELWEQLRQIHDGFTEQRPVWDGNLVDKAATELLAEAGLVDRAHGYNFPTRVGRTVYAIFRGHHGQFHADDGVIHPT